MIQIKLSPSRLCLLMAAIAGLCTSCSDITDSGGDTSLPDGKYPITFTATVDGLTVSRAAGKDAWAKDDPIAVSLNESSGSKTYQIADASNGAMEPVNPNDVYYWKTNTEELKILAWYPAETVTTKDISDQSQGFADFDYLKAETTAKFSATGAVLLSFVHQMAKVTYTLTTDDSSITDLTKATVSIYGYTKASFTKGIVTGSVNGWITPTTDKQVLVVPQNMNGQKFIRVTISGREYFYTPDKNDNANGDANGNLESGSQYNYTIKVTETGLEVTVNTYPSWAEGGSIESGSAAEATAFNVYLADFTEPANTSDYKVTDANGNSLTATNGVYSDITTNGISISLSVAENYRLKKFQLHVVGGSCKQKASYAAASRTYTYTFYDIHSDLQLSGMQAEAEDASSALPDPQAGNYYYVDGTWSSTLEGKPCIGIVFKAGAAGNDETSNYSSNKPSSIHGYVVALQDALSTVGNWGTRYIDTQIPNVDNSNVTAYTGYPDTQTIITTCSNGDGDYQAFGAVVGYRSTVPAPETSSDWYLPSLAQLYDVYTARTAISTPLATVGVAFKTDYDGRYWTSSEKTNSGQDAWYVKMNSGAKESYAKDGTNYSRPCYARAILTF